MPIAPEDLQRHYAQVAEAILLGRVVPFLGAGVNLVDRGPDEIFRLGVNLPSGGELAAYLAAEFCYPGVETCPLSAHAAAEAACNADPHCIRPRPLLDLARVAQFGESTLGDAVLYNKLADVLNPQFTPNSVHHFLASLPSPARMSAASQGPLRHPLIVTTNYDDLMERQYELEGGSARYDLVFYVPDARGQTRFWHRCDGAQTQPILDAANYDHAFFDRSPTVLKIHGTVRRDDPDQAAYVVTENDYVTYLADNTLETLLPRRILSKLQTNHLLFLGYSLQDWNLRVFLQRLKRIQRSYRAWAVIREDNQADRIFWQKFDVEIIPMKLVDYVGGLSAVLRRQAGTGA
jgi:hypothetical protein